MELRKIFDTIPEQFDRFRPRYSPELFETMADYSGVGPGRSALEIGPGTGQATDPVLQTGCDYLAIELGENLAQTMREKYGKYPNFRIVNDDFITHDFGGEKFDLVYSAATIQWIPEEIAYTKVFDLLKPGGTLAMMLTRDSMKEANGDLYDKIQQVYARHFKPDMPYQQRGFGYEKAPAYGYVDFEKREFYGRREFTADEYVGYCGTHCDHMTIPEPHKSLFFGGLHEAVTEAGNKVVLEDTFVLYLARKPE